MLHKNLIRWVGMDQANLTRLPLSKKNLHLWLLLDELLLRYRLINKKIPKKIINSRFYKRMLENNVALESY